MSDVKETPDEILKEKIELKLIWLTSSLRDGEKESLENCVMDLILGEPSADGERERIAFNKGVIWATEYITNRNRKLI